MLRSRLVARCHGILVPRLVNTSSWKNQAPVRAARGRAHSRRTVRALWAGRCRPATCAAGGSGQARLRHGTKCMSADCARPAAKPAAHSMTDNDPDNSNFRSLLRLLRRGPLETVNHEHHCTIAA